MKSFCRQFLQDYFSGNTIFSCSNVSLWDAHEVASFIGPVWTKFKFAKQHFKSIMCSLLGLPYCKMSESGGCLEEWGTAYDVAIPIDIICSFYAVYLISAHFEVHVLIVWSKCEERFSPHSSVPPKLWKHTWNKKVESEL